MGGAGLERPAGLTAKTVLTPVLCTHPALEGRLGVWVESRQSFQGPRLHSQLWVHLFSRASSPFPDLSFKVSSPSDELHEISTLLNSESVGRSFGEPHASGTLTAHLPGLAGRVPLDRLLRARPRLGARSHGRGSELAPAQRSQGLRFLGHHFLCCAPHFS